MSKPSHGLGAIGIGQAMALSSDILCEINIFFVKHLMFLAFLIFIFFTILYFPPIGIFPLLINHRSDH